METIDLSNKVVLVQVDTSNMDEKQIQACFKHIRSEFKGIKSIILPSEVKLTILEKCDD